MKGLTGEPLSKRPGTLRENLLLTSTVPLMNPSVSTAVAAGRAGCELFPAESSSGQSQSLHNSSQVLRVASGQPGEGFQQGSGVQAHIVRGEQDRPGSLSMRCEEGALAAGITHSQVRQRAGTREAEKQHGGKCIQSVIEFHPK